MPLSTVHVVGLGAVGTVMAIGLARAGADVHTYRSARGRVRILRAWYGDRMEAVRVTQHSRAFPTVRRHDAVLLALKWPHLQRVLSLIGPGLSGDNPLLL